GLSQLFKGELDWVVMKALEKDRNRRYESAGALAADVQRYLHDEPVQACPPSAWYRFRKFARRNKVAIGAAGSVAAALTVTVVGLAISAALIWREKEQAQGAYRREQQIAYFRRVALAHREFEANNVGRAD